MEDDEHNDAMREMMGFSSFGSNKRKKLNSGAVSSLPPKTPTTASNSTPLGKRINEPKSPPPATNWNAAKLPSPVKYGELNTKDQPDQGRDQAPTQEVGCSDAKADLTRYREPPRPSLSASAETFLPSRPAQPAQPITAPRTSTAKSTTIYSANDIRSDPSYSASTLTSTRNANTSANDNEVAYTSPYTGTTLTRRELREYATGKQERQEDGSTATVFFKPAFLASSAELWGRWLGSSVGVKQRGGDGTGTVGVGSRGRDAMKKGAVGVDG